MHVKITRHWKSILRDTAAQKLNRSQTWKAWGSVGGNENCMFRATRSPVTTLTQPRHSHIMRKFSALELMNLSYSACASRNLAPWAQFSTTHDYRRGMSFPLATLESRRKLVRVSFRKDFWNGYWKQGQHICYPEVFAKTNSAIHTHIHTYSISLRWMDFKKRSTLRGA